MNHADRRRILAMALEMVKDEGLGHHVDRIAPVSCVETSCAVVETRLGVLRGSV